MDIIDSNDHEILLKMIILNIAGNAKDTADTTKDGSMTISGNQ